ncbi:hypothetical protein SAMN04488523_12021 [Sulfitobacter brevis]|uniref:Uncharacterized protein n=1 Tax=Sulfitobacter brevis TaxID=74348 RepID=A0A1I2G8T7_9RHOB|nr:hypothetical protein SAMN04488523_12021 [Sulfitobacter brevis]
MAYSALGLTGRMFLAIQSCPIVSAVLSVGALWIALYHCRRHVAGWAAGQNRDIPLGRGAFTCNALCALLLPTDVSANRRIAAT